MNLPLASIYSLVLLFALSFQLTGQTKETLFGIQFKPIFSSEITNTGLQSEQEGAVTFTLDQKLGYSFGMVVRKQISKQITLESGINFTQRNYDLGISVNDSSNFSSTSDFRYIIYEIPIQALVYVKAGNRTYLNASFGGVLNFLPSNWESFDFYFEHFSIRRSWIIPALSANIGFEYRTAEDGYFYFGISFQRPFTEITTAGVLYKVDNQPQEVTSFDVSGDYLTFDLRYFFNEPPEKRKRR